MVGRGSEDRPWLCICCCCWSLRLASRTGFSNWVLLFIWLQRLKKKKKKNKQQRLQTSHYPAALDSAALSAKIRSKNPGAKKQLWLWWLIKWPVPPDYITELQNGWIKRNKRPILGFSFSIRAALQGELCESAPVREPTDETSDFLQRPMSVLIWFAKGEDSQWLQIL